MITNGVELGTYRPIDADDEVEIRIRYPEEYRDIKNMDSLRVNTPLGSVPISNFVSRTADQRKIQIDRTDGYRQITVKANVLINPVTNEKYPIAEAMSEIQLWLDEENFGLNIFSVFVVVARKRKPLPAFSEMLCWAV